MPLEPEGDGLPHHHAPKAVEVRVAGRLHCDERYARCEQLLAQLGHGPAPQKEIEPLMLTVLHAAPRGIDENCIGRERCQVCNTRGVALQHPHVTRAVVETLQIIVAHRSASALHFDCRNARESEGEPKRVAPGASGRIHDVCPWEAHVAQVRHHGIRHA